MELLRSKYRSHTCGELRKSDVGKRVTLSGWIHKKRDHGGIIFIDLRDNYGITQIIVPTALTEKMMDVRVESVIRIEGDVVPRSNETVNPKLPTGEMEVSCSTFELLTSCEVLPFQIAEDDNAPETSRLKFRFLELRREKLHHNILLRSKVIREIRNIMQELGFVEFQTPILTSSSPEGARDFIVPSRHHPGKFFALPQAPQQFKQLLMVAGFDRYFQIAPCFRDEDPRADRSPGEFYQCDLEMSFVEQEDVFRTCEQLFYKLFSSFSSWPVTKPTFPRIKYREAMERYGSDKPDLRNSLEISDFSSIFSKSEFRVFKEVLTGGGRIRGIALNLEEIPSRKYFDDTVAFFTQLSGAGLAYLIIDGEEVKGSIAKFVSKDEIAALKAFPGFKGRGVVFLGAGKEKVISALGKLRTKLGEDFNRVARDQFAFCWITDFPMYEKNEETGAIEFSHNPFSMPQGGLDALNTMNPLDIFAFQYDVVCNGHELSSGAIRNHKPEIMYKAFEIAGYSKDEVDSKFGGMVRAFTYGAPPHGGMAPGIDRIVMLLAQEQAIREVIAFPLSQTVEDLLMGAPNTVSEKQLREVHIALKPPPAQKG